MGKRKGIGAALYLLGGKGRQGEYEIVETQPEDTTKAHSRGNTL